MGEENQAQAQTQAIKVTFKGRSTGMGAYTQYRIFSLRKKSEIKPHRTESSRTGNHWTDYWFLLPGKYFICWQDISNSGKHYCGYGLLIVGSPFVQLKDGTIILAKQINVDSWIGKYYADDKVFSWQEVLSYSKENYGVAKWIGEIPEFAKEAICTCILPTEVGK